MRSSAGRTSATGSSAGSDCRRRVAEQARAPRRDAAAPAAAFRPAPRAARSSALPANTSSALRAVALHQIERHDRAGRARRGPEARAAARRSHRRCRRGAASSPMPGSRPSLRMRAASSISADDGLHRVGFELGQRRHRLVVEIERARLDQIEQASAAAGDSAPRRRAARPRPDWPPPRRGPRRRARRATIAAGSRPASARARSSRTRAIFEIEGIEREQRAAVFCGANSVARKRSLSAARTSASQWSKASAIGAS